MVVMPSGVVLNVQMVHNASGNHDRMKSIDKIMCAVFEAADGRQTWAYERFAHTIGTCRMGGDD